MSLPRWSYAKSGADGGPPTSPGARTVTSSRVTEAPVRHVRGVLDTSTVIMLPQLAELTVGPLVATTDRERSARQAYVQQAEASFDPLPFDAQAARAFGRVAASLRRAGRKTQPRAYDAMIAATALANDLPVYTCNPEDFTGIEGLTVVAGDSARAINLRITRR